MNLARLSIKKNVGTYLITLTVVILGIISIPNLPVSFWPDFVAPTLMVVVPYPGVGPEEIEEEIAKPLEEELSTIDGVDEIESICMDGACRVVVRFKWGYDFDEAKKDLQEKTNKGRSRFPREVLEPVILQIQDFIAPGIELSFTSKQRSQNELKDYIENNIINKFLRLEDVATAQIFGGDELEVAVEIDPRKINAYGLNLNQIQAALISENLNVAGGKIESNFKNFTLRLLGKYEGIEEIKNTIISARQGNIIQIRDVAKVSFKEKEKTTISRVNGQEIIGLAIREKSGGNTVAMVDDVNAELERMRPTIPADIQIGVIRDQSTFIRNSINSVVQNAAIGAVLAGLIIILFLGNLRNTLIIAISIPVSIVGTFILINQFGLSINTISLGGLALGVGMVVDASVVVIENIFRHLKENKTGSREEIIVNATKEVQSTVISSTLTSIVVFLPLAFLTGLFAVLLGELALTVVFALSISVIISLSLVPMMSYKLMRIDKRTKLSFITDAWNNLYESFLDNYRKALGFVLRHRILTLVSAAIILVFSIWYFIQRIDIEMLPNISEGEFQIEVTLPAGTKVDYTDNVMKEIENELLSNPKVRQVYTVVGKAAAVQDVKSNLGYIICSLKDEYRPEIISIMDEVRKRWSDIPGARLIVSQITVTQGMQTEPVNVKIVGDDLTLLQQLTETSLKKLEQIPGVVNLYSSVQEGLPEFAVHIDKIKAADLGLSFTQVASLIRFAVLGVTSSRLSSHGSEYDIVVRMNVNETDNLNKLMNLSLTTSPGKIVPLKEIGEVSLNVGPSEIKRFDQIRVIEIKSDVSGRSARDVREDVKTAMEKLSLPKGYYLKFGGQSRAITESFRTLTTALIIAIFLVFVVMATQFNSFLHPFIIAVTIPLSVIGVFLGLYIFDANLSTNAFLGAIMLVGIVVNNGIILIDFINQMREQGIEKDKAIISASALRVRPILITTLTTVFGMLPIALGLGEGSEALKPLGAVVFGGLSTSTLLTLFIIPVVYSLLDKLSTKRFSK